MVCQQGIYPAREFCRKAWTNLVPRVRETGRLHVFGKVALIRPPVGIRHQRQRVVMEKRFGMQQELNMAPISKLKVTIGQLCSALEFGKAICVLRSKRGDAKNEFGNGVAGLRVRDSVSPADLNGKKSQRNDDANRSDELRDSCNGFPVHSVL